MQRTLSFDYQMESVTCDLCGGDRCQTVLTGRDMLHGLPGEWPVVRCADCGLMFTNPRPAADSIGLFYPEDYGPHQAKPSHHAPMSRSRRWALHKFWDYPQPDSGTFSDRLLSRMAMWNVRFKNRNFDLFPWQGDGKLLDYGCGGGSYLVRMKNLGWNVTGMDMSQNAVDHCRRQGIEVRLGVDPSTAFNKESFDVVTAWQVLEHVPSPTQTLEQIHSVLKPKGRLVLGMPNIDSLTAKWFGVCWFPLDLPRHLTHFTPDTVTKILEKTGYIVETIKAQRHGQITQKSMAYLVREKKTWPYKFLAKSSTLCSLLETYSNLLFRPARMVVQARKVEK